MMRQIVWAVLPFVVACGGGVTEDWADVQVGAGIEVDAELLTPGPMERDILIGFKPGGFAARSDVHRAGAVVRDEWADLDAMAARVSPAALARLAGNPNIRYIEEDRPVYASGKPGGGGGGSVPNLIGKLDPNPPAYRTAGTVGEYTWGVKAVQANAIWDADNDGAFDAAAPVGRGVKVCVIDTGIDTRNPELGISFKGGWDFVDRDADPTDKTGTTWGGGHGSHVSGTIAAQLGIGGVVGPGMDANGVVGVAPGVSLYMVRVLDVTGSGSTTNVINGIKWCQQNGLHVASLSLGSSRSSKTEQTAFNNAYAAGLLIFAANGNDGNNVTIGYPAGYTGVIAVGALNPDLTLASFSQTGAKAELSAPGVDVASSVILGSGAWATLVVNSGAVAAKGLEYAALGAISGTLVNCGIGDTTTSCVNKPAVPFVAYVDRGIVAFADKVNNAMAQGAAAVIIANNDAAAPDDAGSFTLGAAGTWVPSVSVSYNAGVALKASFGAVAEVTVASMDYDVWNGTSMATPHAAAVGALVWGAKPSLTNVQMRALLGNTAQDLGVAGWDSGFGYGLIQAKAALLAP
jgi:serine protease